jgi:hypothetical protein
VAESGGKRRNPNPTPKREETENFADEFSPLEFLWSHREEKWRERVKIFCEKRPKMSEQIGTIMVVNTR